MESSIAVEAPTTQPETEESQAKIFKYSDWVHVGLGAETCDERESGRCTDPDHFHAWVRLPNKFQVKKIRERAQAARARVIRQAKDPDSDRSAIIDNQIAEVAAAGKDAMVDELTARNTMKWTQRAMAEVAEGEEGSEEESEFAHIEEDQRRFAEMAQMSPEDRDDGEYQELIAHLEKWNDEIEAKVSELRAPELSSLADRSVEELEAMVREQVVAEQANQMFMAVFSAEQYATCTQRPNSKGHMDRIFDTAQQLEAQAPEIVEALEQKYKELENAMAGPPAVRAEGN